MALTSWLLFGFGLGVIFTLSAVSQFARSLTKSFRESLENWTADNQEGFAAAQVLLRELEAAAHAQGANNGVHREYDDGPERTAEPGSADAPEA